MTPQIIRGLALLCIPVAIGWVMSAPGWDSYLGLITAMSAAIGTLLTAYRGETESEKILSLPEPPIHKGNNTPVNETYAIVVGRRLKTIREQTLCLTLREMAEFLELNSVTELENYEGGKKEFPLELLKRIEGFFRISRTYLDTGDGCIFKHFHLNGDNVGKFLEEGFQPILVSSPERREDLLATLVFSKSESGYIRLAIADRYGSFASNGGGKMNIGFLISALLEQNRSQHDVRIIKATQIEWDELMNGSYYRRHPFGRWGSADYECIDIFDQWFKEYAESRARWNRHEDHA